MDEWLHKKRLRIIISKVELSSIIEHMIVTKLNNYNWFEHK